MIFFLIKCIVSETEFNFGTYEFINQSVVNPLKKPGCSGDICRFIYPCDNPFTCSGIKVNLNAGRYVFEAYGGAGGSRYGNRGGFGGFATAEVVVPQLTTLYIFVGPFGEYGELSKVFNGGGAGGLYGMNGGGATDFRMQPLDLKTRFLIAGGGGGTKTGNDFGNDHRGGFGGGVAGSTPYKGQHSQSGTQTQGGKTQNTTLGSDGTFGYGGDCKTDDCGGGGGGLYGGACDNGMGGGGGSGFVYSKNRLISEISDLTEITVVGGSLDVGINTAFGYATIRSLNNGGNNNLPPFVKKVDETAENRNILGYHYLLSSLAYASLS